MSRVNLRRQPAGDAEHQEARGIVPQGHPTGVRQAPRCKTQCTATMVIAATAETKHACHLPAPHPTKHDDEQVEQDEAHRAGSEAIGYAERQHPGTDRWP